MIPVTIALTFVGAILALALRPGALPGILVGSMLLYPEYLRIPMGLSEMSAPRLIAMVGVLRLIAAGRLHGQRFVLADALLIATYLWSVLAQIAAGTSFSELATHIGRFFDTVLMYGASRLALQSMKDVRDTAIPLGLSCVAMGFLGALESATQYSPFAGLERFRGWTWIEKVPEFRMGFLRAKSSTSHSIYFGMAMAAVASFMWACSRSLPRAAGIISVAMAVLGTLSSLSSGPLAGLMVCAVLAAFEYKRNWIKPALMLLVVTIVLVEVISDRHFYSVIDRLTFSGGTAWYRGRLLEVGLAQWHEYWLVGVGPNIPHHWGKLIDGRKHVDIVNHFLLLAVYGGFLYPLLYLSTHVACVRTLVKALPFTHKPEEERFIFGMAAGIIAIDVASFTVGVFGPVMLTLHLMLGAATSIGCCIQGFGASDEHEDECSLDPDAELVEGSESDEMLWHSVVHNERPATGWCG